MPIKYKVKLNNGNECINHEGKTITAVELLETATARDVARVIHQLNPLIPPQVTMSVLDNFCDAAAQLMSMGYRVVLNSRGKQALVIYPDVKLNGRNINLTRAQLLDNEVTDLTLENAGDLVSRAGVEVRAKAECGRVMTELLKDNGINLTRKEVINVPKVMRAGNGGGTGGNTGENTGGNGGGNNGGGDDGMS